MDNEARRGAVLLPLLALCVFAATAILMWRFLPGPDSRLDYLVIGAVSVMLALAAVFVVIMRLPHR
jgi:hypothetical protein